MDSLAAASAEAAEVPGKKYIEEGNTMKKEITITVANPAGNKTIYVHDAFDRADYARVAGQLLAMEDIAAEQVAYILPVSECGRAEGKMEMCGLEFCGNATRTFGLMCAKKMGISGEGKVFIDTSGSDEILTIEVNTDTNYTRVKMPKYVAIKHIDLTGVIESEEGADIANVKAVDFGGILHLFLPNITASAENFDKIKEFIYKGQNPPAVGVMFFDTESGKLTPVVYVKSVNSTYFEGSCASGTTACATALASEMPDGTHKFEFPQPGGTIQASAIVASGKVKDVYIEGPVEIDEPRVVTVEL